MTQIVRKRFRICTDQLRTALADRGFRESTSGYRKRVSDDTSLVAYIQILKDRQPLLGLFPRVGVASRTVAQFLHMIMQDFSTQRTPGEGSNRLSDINWCIAATLGYLLPPAPELQLEWYCQPSEADIRSLVGEVVEKVDRYGSPFMMQFSTLQGMQAWAENPDLYPDASPVPPQPGVLRAVILVLVGHKNQARRVINTSIAEVLDRGYTLEDPGYEPLLKMRDYLNAN
jgi:hypothetical protein